MDYRFTLVLILDVFDTVGMRYRLKSIIAVTGRVRYGEAGQGSCPTVLPSDRELSLHAELHRGTGQSTRPHAARRQIRRRVCRCECTLILDVKPLFGQEELRFGGALG